MRPYAPTKSTVYVSSEVPGGGGGGGAGAGVGDGAGVGEGAGVGQVGLQDTAVPEIEYCPRDP